MKRLEIFLAWLRKISFRLLQLKTRIFINNVQGMRSKETRNIQLACLGMIAAHFQGEWTETGIPLTLVSTTHILVVLLC